MRNLIIFVFLFLLISISISKATVNVVVSTYEGLVLAADSRLTLTDIEKQADSVITTDSMDIVTKVYIIKEKEKQRVASDYSKKIFQIGTSVGVTCSGVGFLYNELGNNSSIKGIIEDFRVQEGISDLSAIPIEKAVSRLKVFMENLYKNQPRNKDKGTLRLIICGYDENKKRRIFDFYMPQDTVLPRFGQGIPGSLVSGQDDVFSRLIKGFDASLLDSKIYSENQEIFSELRYDIRYDLMSLQDAVDFALFIVRATIEAQRFNQKASMGVGGDIDIAVITPDGFRWIQKKELHGE